MAVLEQMYFGNTLQVWLIASVILAVVFVVIEMIHRVILHRLVKLAALTAHGFDDLLAAVLKNTKTFIMFAASAYFASSFVTLKPQTSALLLKTVLLMLILQGGFWASAGISFWLERSTQKRMEQDTSSTTTITFIGFVVRFTLWTIVLLLMLDNLGVNITGLVAGLGIGGIAVALAVQNVLGDLLASLSIVLDKPFVIGDFIVVDELAGTIEHIGLKTTRIRSLSGEQLIFSNNDLLKSRIHNYKRMSERRIVFSFGVVYQTSLEKLKAVKMIVSDIITNEQKARLDRVHFKNYGDFSLNFEVVYFVTDPDYNIYMDVQERINLEIFHHFENEGIEFAYPTQTVFIQHDSEKMNEK
ncbi:MAG: mechanosensitive ion channel family protein [Desulfuromonadaceae bacterium]|nr:mechanosensitive ion channel family protein [Desulfuromonadaceae bacterium]MDD5105383.1 mechanosensitive ion channel family protein [Desulfuromonadaceae bacterium]